MRFAVVTDVHFGPPAHFEGKLRKLTHLADGLTREVARALATEHRPELLVNLGDVVEDASPDEDERHYRAFLAAIAEARTPLLHVAGNHDQVNLTDEALAELWGHPGALHYSRSVGGLRFLVLRTVYRPAVEIALPEAQLPWLEAELAAATEPVIVLVHHPLGEMDLTRSRWFATEPHLCLVKNRVAVRDLLRRSGKVLAVLSGHAHLSHVAVIDGLPYVTLQSLTENLDDDAPGRPARAFTVVDADPSGLDLTVHGAEPLRFSLRR